MKNENLETETTLSKFCAENKINPRDFRYVLKFLNTKVLKTIGVTFVYDKNVLQNILSKLEEIKYKD
jgi:hypothetical protein